MSTTPKRGPAPPTVPRRLSSSGAPAGAPGSPPICTRTMSCCWRGTDRGGGGAASAPLGRHPGSSARVRIAYIILAHRYPDHLIRLIERLSADGARFFVHIDRKAPAEVF